MIKRIFLFAFSLATAVSLLGGSAFAATANGAVTVASGGLTITTQAGSVDFGTVTLDGTDQTVAATAAPTFRIKDASGSNAGWNVTFSATSFSDGSNTIANTNFTFNPTGGTVSHVSGQAINATNGPKETGGGAVDMSAARKVITTAATYGKGRYDYTPLAGNFSLAVAATTLVGSYTSTLTATVASGP
jgi:hypothetical protein